MVLIAASLGMVLYTVAGLRASESAIIALAAFTFLILYNAVSMRLKDRSDVGTQIADRCTVGIHSVGGQRRRQVRHMRAAGIGDIKDLLIR